MADTSYAPSSPSLGRPDREAAHPPQMEREAHRPARRFLLVFLGLFLGGIGALAGLHMALARRALLPPPPLAATDCIDGKLALLRDAPLEDRTLIAVGSSVTWRNLDMGLLERRLPGVRAYNAAPCFLHVDQTAFLTGLLLERAPRLRTVLTVMAPRDFESCGPQDAAFVDEDLARAYLAGQVPGWLPYLTGFRPLYLAREALTRWRGTSLSPEDAMTDPLGSSILVRPASYQPAPVLDPDCFAALRGFDAMLADRGVTLVVATLPAKPEWSRLYDPQGRLVRDWTQAVTEALGGDVRRVIDGRALPWPDARFADAAHLLYPNHRDFTDHLARRMAERGLANGSAE